LTHGYENPPATGNAPQAELDGGVRQPDPRSVAAAAADAGPNGAGEPGDDRKRLEVHGEGAGHRDDQREPDVHGAGPGEPAAVLEALQLQLEQRQWSGPLPPPAILYQYEQVQAGLAERIVAMAETAATGEIKTRDKLACAEIEQAKTGQSLAFMLTLIALGAAIYFFAVRNAVAGGALLSFPVIMLIRSFLTSLRGDPSGPRHDDEPDTGDLGGSSRS
jgi:uncharacterized membrane protein